MTKVKTKIPSKNYVILGVLILFTVIITLYINSWAQAYKQNKLSISPFKSVVEEINYNDVEMSLKEMNDVVLYVGFSGTKDNYKMEERLVKYIKDNNIVDKFIYLDVTDSLEDDEYIEKLKNEFDEIKDEIEEAPMLIYFKNGVASEVVNSKNGVLYTIDIENISKKYEFNK